MPVTIQSFRDLIAWQKGMGLAESIYRFTSAWPLRHQFGIGKQMERAAVSIPSNIAEGFERRSRKEYLRFVAIALGSTAELETHVVLARRIGLLDGSTESALVVRIREVGRILRGIERGLGRTSLVREL